MATDPLDVPPGSLTLEAITDLLEGGGGTPPGGATGDLQLNNGGVFGNANDVFPGAVLEIDATENFIIDLSANGGGLLFTGGAIIADVAGNLDFESTGGDVTFLSSGGGVELQGTQVLVSAIGGDVTIGSANGSLEINEDGTTTLTSTGAAKITINAAHVNLPALQVFANNAAAISGGLVAGDLYRTGANPDPVCVVH